MKAVTAFKISQAIQLLELDGYRDYTLTQLANASGLNRKTLAKNKHILDVIDFVLNIKEYHQCIIRG